MLEGMRRNKMWARVLLGVVVGVIAVSMLLYLVPGQGTTGAIAGDVVAEVGEQQITVAELSSELRRLQSGRSIPKALLPLYSQQLLNSLVTQHAVEYEAKRLGIRVTDEERAERIRLLLPNLFSGGSFVGMEQYSAEVQSRFQMETSEFEERIRQGLLDEKFRRLVTDGITFTAAEVEEEFRRRNEKVVLEYAVFQPSELEARIQPSENELNAYFEKSKDRYAVPERRIVVYGLLDLNALRQKMNVTEDDLKAYYNEHVERFRVLDRAKVSHILFKTIGKTDAEVEEIHKKAQEVLGKLRKGGKFEDLAKQYSEDTTKEKGGDLSWILKGQTVPDFEREAFSLPKGKISELVKTQYGFHIILVTDREVARTRPLDEVRGEIQPAVAGEKADRQARQVADQLAAAIRQSDRRPLDELAKQFGLTVAETRPVAGTDTLLELGTAPELRETIFRLRVGDLSAPIRSERGYLVLTVKEVLPSHPGTFAEVRDKVLADFRREKAVERAKAGAEELAQRSQEKSPFAAAAKALNVEVKKSDAFNQNGSISGVASGRQLSAAFRMQVGQVSPATQVGANWIVYRVVSREEAKPELLALQRREVEQQVLQAKRGMAFEAFRSALEERMKKEGKLKINADALKRLNNAA